MATETNKQLAEREQQTPASCQSDAAAAIDQPKVHLDNRAFWNGVQAENLEVDLKLKSPAKPEVLAHENWRERTTLIIAAVMLGVIVLFGMTVVLMPGTEAATKDWAKGVLATLAGGAGKFLYDKLSRRE